jgi:hypothetical protein
MQSSLSWIEWLDRLDRVMTGLRQDLKALKRLGTPESLATVELGKRQLAALTNELRLLDRSVLAPPTGTGERARDRAGERAVDRAGDLRRALDTTVFQLGQIERASSGASFGGAFGGAFVARDRMLSAIDAALRDSAREAALLLGPRQLRA